MLEAKGSRRRRKSRWRMTQQQLPYSTIHNTAIHPYIHTSIYFYTTTSSSDSFRPRPTLQIRHLNLALIIISVSRRFRANRSYPGTLRSS
jgi:hypothetical protein